MDDFS